MYQSERTWEEPLNHQQMLNQRWERFLGVCCITRGFPHFPSGLHCLANFALYSEYYLWSGSLFLDFHCFQVVDPERAEFCMKTCLHR